MPRSDSCPPAPPAGGTRTTGSEPLRRPATRVRTGTSPRPNFVFSLFSFENSELFVSQNRTGPRAAHSYFCFSFCYILIWSRYERAEILKCARACRPPADSRTCAKARGVFLSLNISFVLILFLILTFFKIPLSLFLIV